MNMALKMRGVIRLQQDLLAELLVVIFINLVY